MSSSASFLLSLELLQLETVNINKPEFIVARDLTLLVLSGIKSGLQQLGHCI